MNLETTDLHNQEQARKSFEYVKSWQRARKSLLNRAAQLKEKDNKRSQELTKAANSMNAGKTMTTAQIRKQAALGRLALLDDEIKHSRKTPGTKQKTDRSGPANYGIGPSWSK